jgi:sugar-specific transcriptional regulator TrmB
MEWEVLYIHLEREKWKVETFNSGVPVHEVVRYKIDDDLNANSNNQKDQRIISGRTPVFPQQIFSLKSMIAALPITEDVRDIYGLKDEEASALHDNINQMQYIAGS